LGPCFETKIKNGAEIKSRIPLDDPRDTLAFPMTLPEFKQYLKTLQQNIEQTSLNQIDEIFENSEFSTQEKRKAKIAIKKLRQKLIKKSLGLQEFITGDVTNSQVESNHEWLKELVIKLSFSQNPVQTLVEEVKMKLKEKDVNLSEIVEKV
jgi:hypothetical protein